ncbi:MAG: hypothetical protein COB24_12005 [Hyphomicrobiales bacterium]|nr:MAG: hypothetical protein COB24_12005 [Hyphomicrobiales bacterium]
MISIATINQPKYGIEIPTSKGVYQISRDWEASDVDGTSNGLEKFTKAGGWVASNDDLEAILKADAEAKKISDEDKKYHYDFASGNNTIIRTHKQIGRVETATSSGWTFSSGFNGVNSDAAGTGLAIDYDPDNSLTVGGLKLVENAGYASGVSFVLSDGLLYTFDGKSSDGMPASARISIQTQIISQDYVSSISEPNSIESDSYIGDKFWKHPTKDIIYFLAQKYIAPDNVYKFGIIDMTNGGMPTISVMINIDNTHNYAPHFKLSVIDDDHVLFAFNEYIAGSGQSPKAYFRIINVEENVPSLVGSVSEITYGNSATLHEIVAMSATGGYLLYYYNSSSFGYKYQKITINTTTGIVAVDGSQENWSTTSGGTNSTLKIDENRFLRIDCLDTGAKVTAYLYDCSTGTYGHIDLFTSGNNVAQYCIILPPDEEGICLVFAGDRIGKVIIPKTGINVQAWPTVESPIQITNIQVTEKTALKSGVQIFNRVSIGSAPEWYAIIL